ncbi:hypothetical protein [Candidatus Uabimicrobium amorphum]|uniref:Uncharacterized protein n=1 Tax=Uabimicrobium amorphum TaxID=2596890 RepID=A0A5S9F5H9_UABAM|nr:hypothetical protein [Candidatus Uabimicrobium amorphum]BBM86856.1 hypothetical protein UABAM_05256 [Candidatus Uabimicrobium amorphum]
MNKWRKFYTTGRSNSWLYAVINLFHSVVPYRILHVRFYAIFSIPNSLPQRKLTTSCNLQTVTHNNVATLVNCGFHPEIYKQWLDCGATGWIATEQDEIQACYWLNPNENYYFYDWLTLKSSKSSLWTMWWWTAPNKRRTGLAYDVTIPGISYYIKLGFGKRLSLIDFFNRNAMKALNKMKYKPKNYIWTIRCLGFSCVYFKYKFYLGKWTANYPLQLFVD